MTGTVPTDPGLNTPSYAQQLAAPPLQQDAQSPQSVSSPEPVFTNNEDVEGDKVNYTPTLNVTNDNNFHVTSNVHYNIAATQQCVPQPASFSAMTQENGTPRLFCGGTPSSFRNAVHSGPTSFLQYRSLDMTKYQDKIIEGISPVLTATSFGSASSDATLFEVWSRDLWDALVERGLDTLFYLNPKTAITDVSVFSVTDVSVFSVLYRLSIQDLRNQESLFKAAESNKQLLTMNLTFAMKLLKNSLDPEFYSHVSLLREDSDGPLVLLGLIYQAHRGGAGSLAVHAHALDSLSPLSEIPGLDVSVLTAQVLQHLRPLLAANGQDLTTYAKVMALFRGSTVEVFNYKLTEFENKRLCSMDSRVLAKHSLIPDIMLLNTMFMQLKTTGRWEVVASEPRTDSLTAHVASDDTGAATSVSSSDKGKKRKNKRGKWRETKSYSDVCTFRGQTYYWCEKCNSGRGLYSTTHTTATHTGIRGGEVPVPQSAVAAPAVLGVTSGTTPQGGVAAPAALVAGAPSYLGHGFLGQGGVGANMCQNIGALGHAQFSGGQVPSSSAGNPSVSGNGAVGVANVAGGFGASGIGGFDGVGFHPTVNVQAASSYPGLLGVNGSLAGHTPAGTLVPPAGSVSAGPSTVTDGSYLGHGGSNM